MGKRSTQKTFIVGEETTRGQKASNIDKTLGEVTDVTDTNEAELITSSGLSQRSDKFIDQGTKTFSKSYTADYRNARPLYYMLGSVTHNEQSGDVEHTITVLEDEKKPTITVESSERGNNGTGEQATGVLHTSLSLSSSLDEHLEVSGETIGLNEPTPVTSPQAQPAGLTSNKPLPHSQHEVKVDGTTITEVQSFDIDFTNEEITAHGLGSNEPQEIGAESLEITTSIEAIVTNNDFLTKLLNDTSQTLTFIATNGKTLGSGKRGLEIQASQHHATSFEKEVSTDDFAVVTFEGRIILEQLVATDGITETNF